MILIQFFKGSGRFLAAVLWLAVSGCTGLQSQLPDPSDDTSAAAPKADYCLRSGDEIDLQVYREPQLSGTFRIDAGGAIRHPLVGAFKTGGLTVEEVESGLTAVLGEKYLVNPRVMVSIVAAQSSHVVILGEVAAPGVQPIPFGGTMTLLQAVAEAGGFTGLANVNKVTVTRSVEGEEQSIRVRVSKMIAGHEPDLKLEPNDVIMVPEILF